MIRRAIILLLASGAASAALTTHDILSKVFHRSVLAAHDWTSLDLESLDASEHASSESVFLTCGQHSEHSRRLSELATHFGEQHVRIAAVDHDSGHACLRVYGREDRMAQLSDSEWPHRKLPPALKVHPTVLEFLDKDHSQQANRDELLDDAHDIPAVDMLVVKLIHPYDSEDEKRSILEAALGGDRAEGSAHRLEAEAAARSLGAGTWSRTLRRLSAETGGAACPATLEAMACDIVVYKDSAELRHVDRYLRGGGEQAKHCLAQFVQRLSADTRVVSVTGQSIPRLLNYLAKGICQSGDAQSAPLQDGGLTGEGEIVGVADSGLNDWSCFFWDNSDAYSTNRVPRRAVGSTYYEKQRRKVIQYISYADGLDEVAGHGTHVVGTIVGKSLNEDYKMGNGVAPGAKVAFLDVQKSDSPYLSIPDMDTQLLTTLYGSGARVMSHSWGGFAAAYYAERAADSDSFLYDHPDLLLLFAAGNAGANGFDSLYSPCDSKNILCVGSSDSRADGTDDTGVASRLSHFSSMGPTFDGRIKPDIIGPGFSTVSAMSGGTAAMACGTVDMFGTSMATPAVAGSALLVREYFRTKYGAVCRGEYSDCRNFEPSGVLAKAIIIHSAFGLSSYSSSEFDSRTSESHFSLGDTPDPYQGFGHVAVGSILPLSTTQAAQRDLYVRDMFFVKSASTYEMTVEVETFDVPLRVTLVWYDPPSALGATGNLLINNLDLEVLTPEGHSYLGNGALDKKNTIEQVTIRRKDWEDTGTFTVRVSSSTLASGQAQYAALVVTCHGSVTQELILSSARRTLSDAPAVAPASSLSTIARGISALEAAAAGPRSGAAQDILPSTTSVSAVPATGAGVDGDVPLSVFAQPNTSTEPTALRGSHGSWHSSSEWTGLTNYWTSNKYEVDVDVTLGSLQQVCFDPIDISDKSMRLFSVRMKMDASYLGGNDAFVVGVVVTAPNGEKVQIGGYHTYAATTRIWVRSWPVQWTGVKRGSRQSFDGTRVVNMAPMGKDTTGEWSVCLKLLHSGWSSVHYVGQIYLAFDEIPIEDVSAPATARAQLVTDADVIVATMVCSVALVLALVAVVKNREAIYSKLVRRGDDLPDSSVSSVSSADPRPILSCFGHSSDDLPEDSPREIKPSKLNQFFKFSSKPSSSKAKPSVSAALGPDLKTYAPVSSQVSKYESTREAAAIANPLHAAAAVRGLSPHPNSKLHAPVETNI